MIEGFGRAVAEAMSSGLPVVCENRGGYTELINHGQNGFLFNSTNEAIKIITMLKDNPEMRKKIGEAARTSMEEMYSKKWKETLITYYCGDRGGQ